MANKEKTLEQLKEEALQAQKVYDEAKRLDAQKRRKEAERKMAELEVEKEKRKKEVDDAIDNAIVLLKKYTEDYGSFPITKHVNALSFLFGNNPLRLLF